MPADHAPADQASIVNLTNAGFMVGAPQCAWGDMKVAYFTSSTGGLSETEIWVRDTNGGDPVRLTDNAVQDYDPTFSPSTASLRILSSPFTGVLISGDFAAATPFNAIMHGPADVALSAPAYVTLNGTEYVFTGWRVNGAVRNSGVPHIVVPVRGATIVIADYEVSAPAAAVDRIVFAREAGGFAHYNLWTMGRTGGDQRQVTAGIASDTNPCFRPDGKRVVFVRTYVGDPMRRDIVAMNPDGTQQVVLAGSSMGEPNPWSGPRYAWDGTQVVYTSTQDFSASTILIMRADGTGKHAVLPGVQYDVQPSFSPDGAWIVFSRDMNGGPAGMLPRPVICKVPVAGGDVVQLTDADDEEYPYVEDASPSYTVDGAHIVFVRHLFDPIGLYQGAKMRRMAVDHLPADHAGLEDISLGGTVVGTPQPAWDAQWIAYARAAQPGNLAMPDIWRMWADGAQGWSCDVTNTDERDPSFSPQTPAFQVTVQSTPIAGVPIAGEAPFAGATPFGHPVPDDGSVVTLTAPLAVEQNGRRYEFIRWQVNSAPQAAGVVRVQFTVDANTTAVAEYAPTVPTRVTLTVKPGLLVAQGVPIRLIATADAVNNVEYRFLVRPKNALLYSLVTAWQESATYLGWAPTAGTYAVVAEARARNAAARVASRATTVTVTKALSGVKLTDLSASKTTGRPAAFKASPLDGASVEYRFEARRVGDTTPVFVRDYVLDQAGTIWTPTLPGSYTMTVFAREQGTTTPVSAASTFTVSPALSALALARSAPPTVPTAVGVPLDFLATATGGATLEYQFLWNFSATLKVSPTWTKEAYGAGRGYTFRPTQPGVYTFRVYAREKGSTASFQAASSDVKITVNAAMGGFTVACTPGPSSVSIAAVGAVGGAQPRWKFWARKRGDASWTLLQDWQDSRTYADWHPTPGVYDVMVYMKEVGSRAATYDLSRTAVYTAP
jgi:Tol biopolymer transport system component